MRRKRYYEEEYLSRRWLNGEEDVEADRASASMERMSSLLREVVEQMKIALQQAIADAERAETVPYGAFQGQLVSSAGGRYAYQFSLKTLWDVSENARVCVIDAQAEAETEQKRVARVVSRVGMALMITISGQLPEHLLSQTTMIEDTAWLLKKQLGALTYFQETDQQFGAKTLGLLPVQSKLAKVKGSLGFVPHPQQEKAIAHGLGSERTLVIGPGGTGKTATLSDLTCRYLLQGLSVLLVSHTNIATDNAFISQVQAMQRSKKADLDALIEQGKVVRQGDPRHMALLKGKYRGLTVSALAEARMGKQAQAREQLEQTHRDLEKETAQLERDLFQREQVWQPRRDELQAKIEQIVLDLATLRTEQDVQKQKDTVFFATKAEARANAQETLNPLLSEEQQLTQTRQSWITFTGQRQQERNRILREVNQVQTMGWVKRLFSTYDVQTAQEEVQRLLEQQQNAETAIKQLDTLLEKNRLAQLSPSIVIERIDEEVERIRTFRATYGDLHQEKIERLEKQQAPWQKERDDGDAALTVQRTVVDQKKEERSRIAERIEELKNELASLKGQIVDEAALVATTITSVYMNARLLEREFDVVVVDELSMISLLGVLLVASRATQYFVGGGDPMQLAPIVKLEKPDDAPIAKEWLAKDLFTYLGVTIFDAIDGKKDCVLLTDQGRMHPVIAAPINHFIYQDMLTNRPGTELAPPIAPHPEWPLLLVDTTGSPATCRKPSKNKPRENLYHAQVTVALVRQALSSLPPRDQNEDASVPRIGVIAPYRSQVQLTLQLLREAGLAHLVHVGTINTVQSLEFPVVIFDTVEAPGIYPYEFTFDRTFDDRQMATEATRKLNVAWTRARHKLIVIAHRKHLHNHLPHHIEENPVKKQRLLVDLVDWAYERGHVSAIDILSPVAKGRE